MATQPLSPVFDRETGGTPQNDELRGGVGNERLIGGIGDDRLYGGDGDDNMIGSSGDDTLDGGPGVDVLSGGTGTDSYAFGRGSEFDGIYDPDIPRILIGADVSPADLLVYSDPSTPVNELMFTIAGTTDRIYYEDGIKRNEPSSTGIRERELIRFADGISWTYGEVLARVIYQPVSFTRIGTDEGDLLYGAQGNDHIFGRDGNDTIQGAWGNNYLSGENGDDLLFAWDGNDVIDGGEGNDVLTAERGTDRLIGGFGNDHLNGGGYGRDFLQGGEGDDVLTGGDALDDQHRLDDLYRLYRAALGREPDVAGFLNWNSDVLRGEPLQAIADQFMASPEARAKYDNLDNNQFLDYLYRTVLGRAPDPGGYSDWSTALNSGVSRTSVLLAFCQSSEFITATAFDAQAFQTIQLANEIHGQVYRKLRATFGADPSAERFIADTTSLMAGNLIHGFELIESIERRSTAGRLSNQQFVMATYETVLGRAPDAQGLTDWVNALNSGMQRETLVLSFCESTEFKNSTASDFNQFIASTAISDFWSATLEGGPGDDVLISDNGQDILSFQLGQAAETDHVYGLQSIDVLRFDGFGYSGGADALSHMTQVGNNVQFADGGHNIIFHNSTLAQVAQTSMLVSV